MKISGAGVRADNGTSYRFRAGRTQAETQMIEHDTPDTLCPVTLSQSVAGDRWNLLILREIFRGNLRFEQIQAHTGAETQILTVRMKRLEATGMVDRRHYTEALGEAECTDNRCSKERIGVGYVLQAK